MTSTPLYSKCPFCHSRKILIPTFLAHLEAHEKESYQVEQTAFHKTQAIRAEINKIIKLSLAKKERSS